MLGEAVMVLFYDIEGDDADHDDWHSHEHFAERLAVPGFLRAVRWVALDDGPRNLVTYDVTGTDVATSQPYLDRLNDPTPWTGAMMPRFRGMVRGFAEVLAGRGSAWAARRWCCALPPRPGRKRRWPPGWRRSCRSLWRGAGW